MNLFRGYVPTKEKECLEKFKGKANLKTLDDVKDLPEYAGILAEETILIDVDDGEQAEILFKIVENAQLLCRVYKTTRGMHFLMKNAGVEKCGTGVQLACGITADIKIGSKNSYSILKYGGKDRPILYDIFEDEGEEYQPVPKWMTPVPTKLDFFTMQAGDGRNQNLFNYILTLQSNDFTKEEAREAIGIINQYILPESLPENELETILRDDSFKKPIFFKGRTFLHDKFAAFIKNNNHIVRVDGRLHIFKDGVYVPSTRDIESQMIRHIPGLDRVKRSETLAYLDILDLVDTPTSDAQFVAFRNGIYDVLGDTMRPFDPGIVITNRINWDYNPAAYSDIADKTLNKIACNDPQVRALLEELIGYCFYRRNELGKAFILIGDKSNGKSTFLDMVKTLLGNENIASLDLGELDGKFKTAELFRKLANIGDDIGDEFIANAAVFKKLVTGERLNVENKGKDPFEFDNYSKLLFSANDIPRIKDKTGAVQRRLVIVPFDARFSVDDPDFDPFIKYKLREQSCMEYLILLGVAGLRRILQTQRFTVSDRVKRELAEYEQNNNPILGFIQEHGAEIENQPTQDAYRKYREFCIVNNLQPLSNIEFSKQIKKRLDLEIVDRKLNGRKYRIFTKGK